MDGGGGVRKLRRDHHRRPRLDDAGFVGGNLADGVAQDGGVIQADRRDNAHRRRYDVRGVQPPAQAHFDDADCGFVLGKALEGHGREIFEQRGRAGRRVGGIGQVVGPDRFGKPGEAFRGHRLAVAADALAERMQMGGRVEPGSVTGGAQDGL